MGDMLASYFGQVLGVLDEFGHVLHIEGRHGQRHERVSGYAVNTGILLAVLKPVNLSTKVHRHVPDRVSTPFSLQKDTRVEKYPCSD